MKIVTNTWWICIFDARFLSFFKFQISYILVQFDYFVCPVTYDEASDNLSMDCIRHPVFILTEFGLPLVIQKFFSIVSIIYVVCFSNV